MALDSYEKEAFEHIYDHVTWRTEADAFEQEFTKALYDDESVKKTAQSALVDVSNMLIRYNRMTESRESATEFYGEESKKDRQEMNEKAELIDTLTRKKEASSDKEGNKFTPEDERQLSEAKARLKELEKKENERVTLINDAMAESIEGTDEEGVILSSTMLGGTGIGGNGYTITENSVADTRKGTQYILDQMSDKGNLLDQMGLLDNAMNTGGIDLEAGTDVEYEEEEPYEDFDEDGNVVKKKRKVKKSKNVSYQMTEGGKKKTLNDLFREKDDTITSVLLVDNVLNQEEHKKFLALSKEEQDAIIGSEGSGSNRKSIMEVAKTRALTDEAKKRKQDKNVPGPLFTDHQMSIPDEIDFDNLSPRHEIMLIRAGFPTKTVLEDEVGEDGEVHPRDVIYVDTDKVKSMARRSMTEGQRMTIDRVLYEQRNLARKRNANTRRSAVTASGQLNKNDTADSMEGRLTDRDREIGRQLNEKRFLTTEDAEEVIKDPKAAAGRLMNSKNTARNMMGMFKMITRSEEELFRFRLALLAYLVPTRRNTIYEVMSQSQAAGVVGKEDLSEPATMYETIYPLNKQQIRDKLSGKRQFPHEKVFFTMLDEYRDMRDEVRGTKPGDKKPLVNGQDEMSAAEVARILLDPRSGLSLFARLRLLTDESISNDVISKHIDRLDPKEQVLVNEFLDMTARETRISTEALKERIDKRPANKEKIALRERITARQNELNKLMSQMSDLMKSGDFYSQKRIRELDAETRVLEDQLKELNSEYYADDKDLEERNDWKKNREGEAMKAVGKIRKDLFHLLTATPTEYETDFEAQTGPLRRRLLVITRLANRFFMDASRDPEFEDLFHYKDYNPDVEELAQKQLKEENEGTLGLSEAGKEQERLAREEEERKKREEEEKRRRAEEEATRKHQEEIDNRAGIKDRMEQAMAAMDMNKEILPANLYNENETDTKTVGQAITRVVNTYINIEPQTIMNVPDQDFPEVIGRAGWYAIAVNEAFALLQKRKDATAALTEDILTKISRHHRTLAAFNEYFNARISFLAGDLYGQTTEAEFNEQMDQVRNKDQEPEEGKPKPEINPMMQKGFEELGAMNNARDALRQAVENDKGIPEAGLETGDSWLTAMKDLRTQMDQDDPAEANPELFTNLKIHVSNLIAALESKFNHNTDIGKVAADIAALFGLVNAACTEYLADKEEPYEGGRAGIAAGLETMTDGMLQKFGAAAYKTVEQLSKGGIFENTESTWARVMVIGMPGMISDRIGSSRPQLEKTGENDMPRKRSKESGDVFDTAYLKKLADDNKEDANAGLPDVRIFENARSGEAKSLARFRRLLSADGIEDMNNMILKYKEEDTKTADLNNWKQNEIDRRRQQKLAEKKAALQVQNNPQPQPEQQPHPEQQPQPEAKAPEEIDIEAALEEQRVRNIASKAGEENALIDELENYKTQLDRHKTGFLGFFANERRNTDISTLKGYIDEATTLLRAKGPAIEMEGKKITNSNELQEEFIPRMNQLYKKMQKIRRYALGCTGALPREDDAFQAVARNLFSLTKVYTNVLLNLCNSNARFDKLIRHTKSQNGEEKRERADVREYAEEQAKAGQLRDVFYLMSGLLISGEEGGYGEVEDWKTRESLEEHNRQVRERNKNNPDPNPENEIIEEEILDQKEENKDNNIKYIEDEDDEDDEELKKLNVKQNEIRNEDDFDKELQKMEENLDENDLNDDDEPELTEEEEKQIADSVNLDMQQLKAEAKKARDDIRKVNEQAVEMLKPVPIKNKDERDVDLAIKKLDEQAPPGGPEQAAANRQQFKKQTDRPLKTSEKVYKVLGWGLFGAIRLAATPFKWLGNGVAAIANKISKEIRRKKSGMQKTFASEAPEVRERRRAQMEGVKGGTKDQDIIEDDSRVPMMWAEESAGDPDKEPEVTIGARLGGDMVKYQDAFGTHSWMRLSYTKRDKRTGRKIRTNLDMGYGPKGGFSTNDSNGLAVASPGMVASGNMMPGALWDERGSTMDAGKTYKATNRQINQLLLEAEQYPSGGFNLVSRNCTTFIADVTAKAGINTTDVLKSESLKIGAGWIASPLLALLAPITQIATTGTYGGKSAQEDLAYERLGERQLNETELDRMGKDNGTVLKGYTPGSLIQNIIEQDGDVVSLRNNYVAKDMLKALNPGGKVDKEYFMSFQDRVNDFIAEINKIPGMRQKTEPLRLAGREASGQIVVDSRHFSEMDSAAIADKRKEYDAIVKKASDWYRTVDNRDINVKKHFFGAMKVLNFGKEIYDQAFREARRRELVASFADSDVSSQMKALLENPDDQNNYEYEEQGKGSISSSPALMIGMAIKGKGIDETENLNKQRNGTKEKMINKLFKAAARNGASIWKKEKFTQEDADIAFNKMMTDQDKLVHEKYYGEPNQQFRGVDIMQALMFERIYGGLKNRLKTAAVNFFKNPGDDQEMKNNAAKRGEIMDARSKKFLIWLRQDLGMSRDSHLAEVEQIKISIAKSMGLDTDAEIPEASMRDVIKKYNDRLIQTFIVPIIYEVIPNTYSLDQATSFRHFVDLMIEEVNEIL